MNAATDVFSQALSLPLTQRAELAHKLIDSLQPDEPPLGASDDEIQARLAAISSGQYDADDWRHALARMRASLAEAQSQAE